MATKVVIPTNRKRDLWIQIGIMLLLSLIIVMFFFFIYLPWTTHHGESITVPDLRKMKVDEVESYFAEHDMDLRYEVQDSVFDLDMSPLTVKEQYPKAGSKVKEGRKIYLTIIAKNPRMITMPKLIDLSQRSVEMNLKRYKLQLGEVKYKPYLGAVVLEQSVPPGQKVPEGTKINLIIGDGSNNKAFTMPDLVGKSLAEAEFEISANGLVRGTIISPSGSGVVTKQQPVAGTEVRTGDFVDLWISEAAPSDSTR